MIAGLPYDAEVEYLESTGTQYIDTGISIARNLYCEVSFCLTVEPGSYDNAPFGANNRRTWLAFAVREGAEKQFRFGTYSSLVTYGVGGDSYIFDDMDWHVAKIDSTEGTNNASFQLDDNEAFIRSSSTGSVTNNIYLFGCNGTGVTNRAKCRIGYCEIKSTTTNQFLLDLIPVRFTNELGQPEGAMYDRVSRKLFRNAGTGSFTIGPDVATPVMGLHFFKSQIKTAKDYVQNGLIAMWDGIENAGWGVHDASATTWKDLVSGTQSDAFQSTEEITENSVITTSRSLILIDDVKSVANGIDTLTIQRVAGELVQGRHDNAAGGVSFCTARFGTCMYFRHVPSNQENGYGYGPMGYSFPPKFGSFGKGFYSPSSTYGLNSRTMIVGANNNPVSGYEGTYQLPAYGTALTWGGASTSVDANISPSTNGRVMNCCIRVYSRALTAAEIAANYAVDKRRFNLP